MNVATRFKIHNIRLQLWQEAIGVYEGLSSTGNLILKINGKNMEVDIPDAALSQVLSKLSETSFGDLISILRTDNIDRPFLVRIIRHRSNSQNFKIKGESDEKKKKR